MMDATRRALATYILPPLAVTVVLGVIGAFSVWAQQPWLIPSLGSAIFLQVLTPEEPSARTWNVAVGQLVGAACGFAGVFLSSAELTPSFIGLNHLTVDRVLATGLAVFLTLVFQYLLRAPNAAGGATALVVALGAETPTFAGAGRLALGILLVTAMGETARRFILRLK